MKRKKTATELLKRLLLLRITTPQYVFLRPIGVELEGFVFDKEGDPVDLTEYIEILKKVDSVWYLGHDLGKNQIEISFNPCESIHSYLNALITVFEFLAHNEVTKEWQFQFSGTAEKTLGAVEAPAYNMKIKVLGKENPKGAALIVPGMTGHSATQFNFGFVDAFADFPKKVLYALINWGPAICVFLEGYADDLYDNQRSAMSYQFAHPCRGPEYKSWEFCDNVLDELFRIPQLFEMHPDGRVDSYEGLPKDFNQAHLGTIYWLARYNGVQLTTAGRFMARIEGRAVSSMEPHQTVPAVLLHDRLLRLVKRTPVEELPVMSENDWYYLKEKGDPERAFDMATTFISNLLVGNSCFF